MERPMRFCMITTFYPPYNFGGDGISVHRLSNELARRGHRVDVIHCIDSYLLIAAPPSAGYRDHPNVTVHGLKSRFGALSPLATHQSGSPALKSSRIRAVLKERFDVIHYHNISLIGGPGILEYGNAIKLYTLHDYWLICPTHALFRFNRAPCLRPTMCFACSLVYKRPPQWWRYSWLMRRAVRNVDAFIAPSLTSKRKHEQFGLDGRIVHLPNFVSFPEFDSAAPGRPARSASERPYFLFVGRLEKLKGLHTVIRTFERYPQAELWIAGTGSEEASLRESVRDISNVRFVGQQSQHDLAPLYRDAVALIYPAVNFQAALAPTNSGHGAPLVIIEAFSRKTPVVANNLGRIPALLEQTGGGLVYASQAELIATMDRLLHEPALRSELGERGYAAYTKYWTADAHLTSYLGLIQEIAENRCCAAEA